MEFYNEKRFAIKAAKELHYNIEIINRLKEAKNSFELSRIMTTARERIK